MKGALNTPYILYLICLYGRDVPLNTCIDNLDVENIGIIIIISQRATVTEYPEVLLPRPVLE